MRLRSSLVWLVVGTAIPLIAFGVFVATLLVRHEQDNFVRALKDRNRAFMSAVDAELRGHLTTLQAVSALRSLARDDLETFHRDIQAVLPTQEGWEDVMLEASDGRRLLSARAAYGTPLAADPDASALLDVVRKASPVVAGIRMTAHDTLGVPLRAPVVRDGRVVYVLTALVRPQVFEKLIRDQQLQPSWISGLVDAEGRFIARVPPRPLGSMAGKQFLETVATSREGWYRGFTAEGLDTYTAYVRSEMTDWSLGIAMPSAVVLAGSQRATWAMIGGALLCVAAAVAVAIGIGRRIANPIAALAANADALDRGPPPKVHTDISEVRELVVALERASDAIVERHKLVEHEHELLKESDRAKDEFLAMLSHELRNPLAALTAASHLLKIAPPGSEAARSAQSVVERQTQQMTRLVEELLDISRLTVGKTTLEIDIIDLADVASQLVGVWRQAGRLARHTVTVDAAAPAWIHGDRARIEQIVANLLDNALKFTAPGRGIALGVTEAEGRAQLVVSDLGRGIEAHLLDRVFGLFVQGSQGLDRSRGGMGVGLAIVRRLVELHGGTIRAESAGAGTGSRFTVTFPSVAAPAKAPEAPVASAAPAHHRILLIEDNDDARITLAECLVLMGHDVHPASSGEAGLDALHAGSFDVALVDIGLPGIDGYEVARRIRALELPITLIAVTGYGQSRDRATALDAGFDHHVTKPLSQTELGDLLARVPIEE